MLPDIWQFQGKIIYFKTILSSQVLFQDFPSILIFSYIFFEISLLYKCSFKLKEGLPLGKIFFINQIWEMKFKKHHSIMATVQVNLFQKHLFLNQSTHNMTTDCSLITDSSTRKIQVQNMLCTKIVLNVKTKTKSKSGGASFN